MAIITPVMAIPKTSTRLKNLVQAYVTTGGYDPSGGLPALSGLDFVGALTKISFPVNRGASERRELNFDVSPGAQPEANGGIIEIVPGLVDADGCTMTFIWQYKNSFMEVCGFGGGTLEYQIKPLLWHLVLPAPAAADERSMLLLESWMTKVPHEFSVEDKDDLKIRQEVSFKIKGVRQF